MAIISPATLSVNVAALSITVLGLNQESGATQALTIRSLAGLRPVEFPRNGPLLFPALKYRTAYTETRQSVGASADTPVEEITYTVNYIYAHCWTGVGRNPTDWAADIDANCQTICDTIAANITSLGVNDILSRGVSDVEIVQDPTKQAWYGALIQLGVLDYRNL